MATAGNEAAFRAARSYAIAGLTLGFLTSQVGFMSAGGKWFGMLMLTLMQWNGVPDAFRFFITLLVLVSLTMLNGVDETRAAH